MTSEADRPQYFECHGTSNLAGDASETEAISEAFFSAAESRDEANTRHQKLVVGSIKSVVGHTEGTVGIAGVMKAYLALKNATLPPNLLFESLNPEIEPFYGNL